MAGETEDEIPESGAVFTFGKSKFADNAPSKFWLKNDKPVRISCGDEHTALITDNGKLYMFGSNNWGQLGLGTKSSVNKPMCVKALKSENVKLAACGRNHTVVCTSRGNVYAAGGNGEGQLGLGHYDERMSFQLLRPFAGNAPIKMLAAGSNISAALTEDGKLFMWGDNSEGQIGLGNQANALEPQEMSVGCPVLWVSCGYYHSAFITTNGDLFTFGECDSGKLGLPSELLDNHRKPQKVPGIPDRVIQVTCGGGHTVGLTESNLYTFGLGQFGQLGHGTLVFESHLPRAVAHFQKRKIMHVSCGENHTAVITDNGLLYTFGDGRHGKLGLGEENFTNQFKPTLCPQFIKYHVQSVACGGCHMLVLATPRLKDVSLEKFDMAENRVEMSYHGVLAKGHIPALQRSISARVRRRERERSPEHFGFTFHTLQPLKSAFLGASLPEPSRTVPPRALHRDVPDGREKNSRHPRRRSASPRPESTAHERLEDVQTYDSEIMDDNESVKGLGDTTDLLNMTHVIKMEPGNKTMTMSPVRKDKVPEPSMAQESEEEDEEDDGEDDDDEEEEEEEEDDEDEEENSEAEAESSQAESEEMKPEVCQSNGCCATQTSQESKVITEETVPDGVPKVSEVVQNPNPEAGERLISTSSLLNKKEEGKSRRFFGPNRTMSLFKRTLTAEPRKSAARADATGLGMSQELPPTDSGTAKSSEPHSTTGSDVSPQPRGRQREQEPATRGSHSTTCTVL